MAEHVEAWKDFFYTAVDVGHLHFETCLTILSYKVDENNKQQPAYENYDG